MMPAILLGALLALVALNVAALLIVRLIKRREKSRYRRQLDALRLFAEAAETERPELLSSLPLGVLMEAQAAAAERFRLSPGFKDTGAILISVGAGPNRLRAYRRLQSRLKRRLRGFSKTRRLTAAFKLRFCGPFGALCLSERLPLESSPVVRLRAAESLIFTEYPEAAAHIMRCLRNQAEAPDHYDREGGRLPRRIFRARRASTQCLEPEYLHRIAALLVPVAGTLASELIHEPPRSEAERIVIARVARRFPHELFESILRQTLALSAGEAAAESARVLEKIAPRALDGAEFYEHDNPRVRAYALLALGRRRELSVIPRLADHLANAAREADADLCRAARDALLRALGQGPDHLKAALRLFYRTEDSGSRRALAEILDQFIDFFLTDLRSSRQAAILKLVSELAALGSVYGTVSFVNRSNDLESRRLVMETLRDQAVGDPRLAGLLSASVRPEILEAYGLALPAARDANRKPTAAGKDRPLLYGWLIGAFVAPLGFLLWRTFSQADSALSGTVSFTVLYVFIFGWYALALNATSLLFLSLSCSELSRQLRRKEARSLVGLFMKSMAPSISILVPAYREEASIVQTVQALLSQRYPDFEVIVINDGSPDGTMRVLEKEFDLERRAHFSGGAIATEPVLGTYRSRSYGNLVVLDKANGGKADSLNAGINVARGRYICGIDADSLLEPDALLRVIASFLDEDDEVIAGGGNILPVNGCEVESGDMARVGLSSKPLAGFQTAEYLRAFLAGRLGWARIKSLLIISGAFGVFSRQRVLESGGYLTRNSRHGRDTVGEDMELVVRLTREGLERRLPFTVRYVFDANCWTEVPEDAKTLGKQRDRWQRGLLEILTWHRRMIGNPRYGRIGLVALPYYILFETIGPMYELLGWAVTVLGLMTGVLPTMAVLFVLFSAILLGIFVSLASVAVGELQVLYFSWREDVRLVGLCLAENLGYRQWMSAIRVSSFFGYLSGKSGWGSMKRAGYRGVAKP